MKFGLTALITFALSSGWAADPTTRPALSYSKLLGGSGSDVGVAVATDASGNVYVAGTTTSLDFPVVNAFQKRIGGAPFRASTDGGKTWTTPGIPDPVYAVAGSAKAPATVYAGTSNAMYKSVDSGKTWTVLSGVGKLLINALWVDSDTPAIVHAATDGGMLKSDDAGVTWRMSVTGNVLALAAHPSKPARLFAAMNIGSYPRSPSLYRTTNGGTTWTLLGNSPLGPFTLTCDATNPDVLYAGASVAGFTSGSATSLYKSTDAGDTWTLVSKPRLAISTFALASGPTSLFAATLDGLQRSTDGGASWKATTVTSSADSIAISPTATQTLYVSAAAGIFGSTDGGSTWTSILPVRQLVESLTVAPTVPPSVFVGGATGRNVFVSKWSADGKQMLYSTYLGGSYRDYVTGIAVDRQGNAYVAGYTYSTDFPVSANAIQATNAGNFNAFLAKIGPNGDTLPYSTYLGGSVSDAAFGIALDADANVYLTGYAGSSDFPVTQGALQTRLQQNCPAPATAPTPFYAAGDAFVAKIATGGAGLRYATFLGGTCADEGIGIAVDPVGNAYVAGATNSPDFPATKGALSQTYGGGEMTGFLAKLSPQGSTLEYATYLGGKSSDSAFAVTVDAKGAAYVTGTTWGFDQETYTPNGFFSSASSTLSFNYPLVGFPGSMGGAAFVAKIDPTGSSRQYLKYLGGTWGAGTAISLDQAGNAWVAGRVLAYVSTEVFPTAHPFQALDGDGFVSQISPDGSSLPFSSLMDSAQQIALDPSGNAFLVGSTYDNVSKTSPSAMLVRLDGAVTSAATLEEPQRIVKSMDSVVDRGITAGEIVVLAGSGLGPQLEIGAAIGSDGKLATSLGGTTVTFNGVAAPLLSVQAQKVVCIVPFGVWPSLTSTVTVQAKNNGSVSNSILLPVVWNSIEILAVVNADGSANSSEHRAAPGSIVTFYGAGFGDTNPSSAGKDGQINGVGAFRFAGGTVAAKVGDQDAQVLYAGPAPGQVAGIVQINARVPQIPAGSYTTLVGWAPVADGGAPQAVTLWAGQP